jgi:hypothetical protein
MAGSKKKKSGGTKAAASVYRLRVTLDDIEPPIWRELEVDGTVSLAELHLVFQRAFGWQNDHLFEFQIAGARFGDPDTDEFDSLLKDASKRRLNVVASSANTKFQYIYDFGDDWVHEVEVLEIRPSPRKLEPKCIAGERAGPPEDCGGPHGYARLLEVLADRSHPEHDEVSTWAGPLDPEAFHLARVNDALAGRPHKDEIADDPLFDLETFLGELPEPDLRPVLRNLILAGKELPRALASDIVALGDRVVGPLIELLVNPDLTDEFSPGQGWASIHAARLLGEMRATASIEPMIELLAATDWDNIVHDAILLALPKMGEAVLEPALREVSSAVMENSDLRSSLLSVLAQLGARDPRIFDLLLRAADEDPEMGCSNLATYGDPAALPLLRRLFDEHEVEVDRPGANQLFIELEDAITALGGTLTEAQTAKLEMTRKLRLAPAPKAVSPRKLGRNDPCHCGSGKKYKKCHLESDARSIPSRETLH